MKIILPILIIFLFTVIIDRPIYSQTSGIICAGQKGIKYQVSGDLASTFHWNVEGGQIISDTFSNTITVNWGKLPGLHTIKVFEEKPSGCFGYTKQLKVGIQPSPDINLGGVKYICEGEKIELNNSASSNDPANTYQWQDGSTFPTYTTYKSGIYWVQITNTLGCSYRDSVIIFVNQPPKVNLGNDTMLCSTDEIVLDAGINMTSYYWKNGSVTQTILAHENDGEIWVKVTDSIGCVGIDSIKILQCKNQNRLVIPKVFLPNRGSSPKLWQIGGIENFPNASVKIYDRWGILIFISDRGYTKAWDGIRNGKELPVDAYYYIINPGDGTKEIVGSVTIIR